MLNHNPLKGLWSIYNQLIQQRLSRYLRVISHLPRTLLSYHYAYAKAYELSKRQYESIAHFRLAYLYSKDNEMKKRTLLERAEAYAKIGFHSEATLVLRIFLKKFPHSRYETRAFLASLIRFTGSVFSLRQKRLMRKPGIHQGHHTEKQMPSIPWGK